MPPFKYDSRLDLQRRLWERPGTWDIPGYSRIFPVFPMIPDSIQEIPLNGIAWECYSVIIER